MSNEEPEWRSATDTDPGEEALAATIEKSRKRQLSPSTFRGDQAVDRLIAQELSASPLLKRNKSIAIPTIGADVAKMQLSQSDFYAYMEGNVTGKLASIERDMLTTRNAVAENTRKIDEQADLVKKNSESIASIRKEMCQPKPPTPLTYASAAASMPGPSTDEELAYLKARRSARIWPIRGNSDRALWESVGVFMSSNLCLPNVKENMIESVSRPLIPSGAAAKDEVLVVFKDSDTRDAVMGASAKLADFIDPNGKPTAGLRIEVPRNLRGAFSALFKFGQLLRVRHGEGTRKHVKFDDLDRTLYLNVKLPGDERWSRVSVEVARKGLRARESVTDEALERRMDLAGPPRAGQRGRAASESTAPTRPVLNPPAWTGRASTSAMEE